jgi:hypothetical protein
MTPKQSDAADLRRVAEKYEVASDTGPDTELGPEGRTVVWRERDAASWPHSHADNPLLATDGVALSTGDGFDTTNLFVRCHDCLGERSDEDCSCGGTGFDWTDTVDARRTVEAAIGETP